MITKVNRKKKKKDNPEYRSNRGVGKAGTGGVEVLRRKKVLLIIIPQFKGRGGSYGRIDLFPGSGSKKEG